MAKDKEGGAPTEWKPEPAESFQVEFSSGMALKVQKAMNQLGFVFRRSGPEEGGQRVAFEGERHDGTKVIITFEKGPNYKSPRELLDEKK